MSNINLGGKPFHFIGIGGIGMSALAYIVAKRGLPVSGSDIRSSHITDRLKSVGAKIFTTQSADNILNISAKNMASGDYAPQIICSTAINPENAEYKAAIDRGYPIYHRSDLLAALINDYQAIAVAGTHGKTTTSSLIGYLLLESGLDPTVIIGGEVSAFSSGNARIGDSPYLVAEADESDGSLVKHHPSFGIITNIELDHPDHYESLDQLVDIFQQFVSQSETVIACIDCPVVKENIKADITYSLNADSNANYIATDIVHGAYGSEASIIENGVKLGHLRLQLSGDHNISNTLATIAVGRQLGLEFDIIAKSLATFTGTKRRFEYKGKYNGATLIDDYAHHPREITCTLEAGKARLPQYNAQRLVAIFQPHRYSRTATFIEEFAQCFELADVVIVTDIYSAGETNQTEINGEILVETIKKYHDRVYYQPDLSKLPEFLANFLETGDLTLFLGAGNLNQTIPQLLTDSADKLVNVG